jgi:hypothetical protein
VNARKNASMMYVKEIEGYALECNNEIFKLSPHHEAF